MKHFYKVIESGLRFYSRLAPTGRGCFQIAKKARHYRPRERWCDVFWTPDQLGFDLDLATYPDFCMAFGLYELNTARLIKKILRPGDHFVDGGANLGYFTTLAAKCVGPSGRVDAFEPQPDNHARLLVNLKRNGLTASVHVHNLALSDNGQQVQIHCYQDKIHNHGCSSLFVESNAVVKTSNIDAVRMDQVLVGTQPRLIKLDVEGAEPLVVDGMTELLSQRQPPAVIVEFNPSRARLAGFSPRTIVDRLMAAQPRYRIWVIGFRLRRIDQADETLDSLRDCNLYFSCD